MTPDEKIADLHRHVKALVRAAEMDGHAIGTLQEEVVALKARLETDTGKRNLPA